MPGVCQSEPADNFVQALRAAAGLEGGTVTAFLATLLAASSVVLGALLWGFQALVLQERLTAAVDLSALAAADTQRGLVSGIVCENAESILKTVDVVMTTCRIVGDGVMVSGQLRLPPMTLEASAIAGEK
jgi:secretion/DNA translocation related TadE-like protein